MIRFHNCLILIALAALLFVTAGCQQEEVSSVDEASKGRIVLNLSPGEAFVETRTPQTVSDISGYIFTLSGTDSEGTTVNETITFAPENESSFSSIIEAGTYTLTVENISQSAAEEGNGHVYYKGTSDTFTLQPGHSESITVSMGAPQNAMVSLAVDDTFNSLYTEPRLTRGSATVTTFTPGYFMVPEGVTKLTFSLSATGQNHAQEIEGSEISVDVVRGEHTTVTLSAQPINGAWVIVPVVSGEHSGEFDVKVRRN